MQQATGKTSDPITLVPKALLETIHSKQKAAFQADPVSTASQRRVILDRLYKALQENEARLIAAIKRDFGQRSEMETRLAELNSVYSGIQHAKRHLKSWMRRRRVSTDMLFWPGRCRIIPQPLGVVGIISPWNYPLQLTVKPLVAALAAGNRAIVKPSELTPTFSATFKGVIESEFAVEEVAVVTGGADVAQALTELPLDHLLFTGSTKVGKMVARAAAVNLVPTTLELGGKSPAIVDESADLDQALTRIIKGKMFNSGQTCIAPDYLMVPKGMLVEATEKTLEIARQMYPSLENNPDVTTIINDGHFKRLKDLLADADKKGATIRTAVETENPVFEDNRLMPLTILTETRDDMAVMQEEIFGPILPILAYSTFDEAISYVRARPYPLSLYWFGTDAKRKARIMDEAMAGGITINDTLLHNVQENLPFGGVGASGMGAYHGVHGFDAMSHMKGVFIQAKLSGADLLAPPLTPLAEKLLAVINWWSKR